MTNFIFNWADAAIDAATLDLSTGTYYAHLVTSTPLLTDTTVANLVLPTSAGYAGKLLTNMVYTTQKWSFDNFSFPRYTFATLPPIGMVICKRVGASFASTDPVICYSDFVNSLAQVILGQVGIYVVSEEFTASGAISFAYRYQYSSGSYINGANGGVPFGLIYLLGTANNTTSFSNPSPTKLPSLGSSGSVQALITDRSISGSANSADTAWDFGNKSVRVGNFGYTHNQSLSTPVVIYGSNNLPSWSSTEIINNANWTQLATVAPSVNTTIGWHIIPVSSSTYWRYLRFSAGSSGIGLNEIELYNSSIISPTQNLI
jgi:hypothetical protein